VCGRRQGLPLIHFFALPQPFLSLKPCNDPPYLAQMVLTSSRKVGDNFMTLLGGHPVCAQPFLASPWKGSDVCLDVSCYRDAYIEANGLPKDHELTKLEKIKQRWDWKVGSD